MKIQRQCDFWSGVTFMVTGAGFSWGATDYAFGDSSRPGPGFFPFGLGIVLAIAGVITLFHSLTASTGSTSTGRSGKIGRWGWKPLMLVTGAVAAFGWILPNLGLFIAMPLLVIVCALGGDEFHWGEALLTAAVLTVGCWALFSWGLKLTIPLWPTFLAH
jgi:hypothetical protein